MSRDPASAVLRDWSTHFDTLSRQVHENAGGQCLLWIDPAQVDPFAGDPLVERRRVRVPISHANFDVRRAPYLVSLDISKHDDAKVFERSVATGWNAWEMANLEARCGQSVSGWVVTGQSPESLALHWAINCHIHRVNRLCKFLRFQDPSVREWLWPVLSAQQRQHLLGGAGSVIAFNRSQKLMTHVCPAESAGGDSGEAETTAEYKNKLLLNPTQWRQVSDYAALHHGWLHACSLNADCRDALLSDPDWVERTLALLQFATVYGINDPDGRALFVAHALQMGEDFHLSEKMKPIFYKTKAGEHYCSACDEVSGLTFDYFQRYLAEL